jgi:anthranilate 1,2-dioxygenase small subunit
MIANIRVHGGRDGGFECSASYLVLHSTEEGETRIYSTGKYEDEIVFEADRPRFRKKIVVADTFAIDNLLAVPL